MRRLTFLMTGLAALVLAAVPAGIAANPQVNHFDFSGTDSDPDFCGTGMTVNISFSGHGTEWFAPNQPVDYRNVSEGNVIFTNAITGETVILHFAGSFSDTIISGDGAGLHTHEFVNKGVPELIRAGHGGVLSRDAGYIVFHATFNGDEFISSEIFLDRGPHPDAESSLFCNVVVPALGLG